jgi:hypothetical protein
MKIGTEDKKKLTIFAVVGTVGLACAFYMYSELSVPDTPKPASAPVPAASAPVAVSVAPKSKPSVVGGNVVGSQTAALQLDPTLRMGPMLVTEALVYSGSGRNIFSQTSVQVEIPKAIAPARPKVVVPVYVPPVGPPPPPPIDLKFFGTATSKDGARQVFLLHGEDVFLASAGDVVQRRYKVISVAANSIVVEDMTNNNRQTLPLLK